MKMTNNVHIGEIVFIATAEHEESELTAYLNGEKTKYTVMPAEICDITEEGNIVVNPYHITFFTKKKMFMNLESLHWKITFLAFHRFYVFQKKTQRSIY